jgi:hypothetical protein
MRPQHGLYRRRVFDAHERAVSRPKQKLGFDQGAKQGIARRSVQPPEPARLRLRQPQAWHFQKLTLDAPEHFVVRSIGLRRHELAPRLKLPGDAL